jgi:hypothetical protein
MFKLFSLFNYNLIEVGSWANIREHLAITLVVISLHQWESDLRVVELLDVTSACLASNDFLDLDDLNNEKLKFN